jgi:hypothetical protein
MGFFKDLVGGFTGANDRRAADAYMGQEAANRAASKKVQYDLLGRMRGPKLDAQNEARIKALEDESKLGLEEDPNFQGQLRQARVGGAQSLASIQNTQAATGAGGGFQNVGSMNDVYDRLGVQLADLAGQQQQFKEQKRDRAADARQQFADAQIEYQNAVIAAQQAIEAGDAAAAQAALQQAYQARAAAQNKLWQNVVGVGSLAVGAATANPGAAKGGADTMQDAAAPAANTGGSLPTASSSFGIKQSKANQPYYSWR